MTYKVWLLIFANSVKQEVAKEGVFLYEYSIKIVRSWDLNPGHWLDRLARRRLKIQEPEVIEQARRQDVDNPERVTEARSSRLSENNPTVPCTSVRQDPHIVSYGLMASTPTPALLLHCFFSSLLIIATIDLDSGTAYSILLGK